MENMDNLTNLDKYILPEESKTIFYYILNFPFFLDEVYKKIEIKKDKKKEAYSFVGPSGNVYLNSESDKSSTKRGESRSYVYEKYSKLSNCRLVSSIVYYCCNIKDRYHTFELTTDLYCPKDFHSYPEYVVFETSFLSGGFLSTEDRPYIRNIYSESNGMSYYNKFAKYRQGFSGDTSSSSFIFSPLNSSIEYHGFLDFHKPSLLLCQIILKPCFYKTGELFDADNCTFSHEGNLNKITERFFDEGIKYFTFVEKYRTESLRREFKNNMEKLYSFILTTKMKQVFFFTRRKFQRTKFISSSEFI